MDRIHYLGSHSPFENLLLSLLSGLLFFLLFCLVGSQKCRLGSFEGSAVLLIHLLVKLIISLLRHSLLGHKSRPHIRSPVLGHLELGNAKDFGGDGRPPNFDGAVDGVALTELIPAVVLNDTF